MKLFGRGTAILLLIAIVALSFSGCIDSAPVADTSTNTSTRVVPGAQIASYPLGTNYIQNGAITSAKLSTNAVSDTQLAANAIITNYTINTTAVTIAGTTLINMTNESKITLNRQSMLQITFSGSVQSSGASHARAVVDNVEVPSTINLTSNTGLTNWTTITAVWVNNTVQSGTHNVWVQGNTSAGALNLLNTTLLVIAYPK